MPEVVEDGKIVNVGGTSLLLNFQALAPATIGLIPVIESRRKTLCLNKHIQHLL